MTTLFLRLLGMASCFGVAILCFTTAALACFVPNAAYWYAHVGVFILAFVLGIAAAAGFVRIAAKP